MAAIRYWEHRGEWDKTPALKEYSGSGTNEPIKKCGMSCTKQQKLYRYYEREDNVLRKVDTWDKF